MNRLSEDEMLGLAASSLGLGAGFAILFFGGPEKIKFLLSPDFVVALVGSTILVAISFIPHEMAHRHVARTFEAYAEFEMWGPGVLLAIATSFLGFIFAAPGGVRIYTREGERYGRWETELTVKDAGVISMVGPLVNVSLALVFAFLASLYSLNLLGTEMLALGAKVNAYLAIFNLIPVFPMDGYKVLRWNVSMWAVILALSILSFYLTVV